MKTPAKHRRRLLPAILAVVLSSIQGYELLNATEDAISPMHGWETVVVAPLAKISIQGGDQTDSDAEMLVTRFLSVLDDRGIKARKATPEDHRYLTLSMRVFIGPNSPFLLRIQHQERARFNRDGEEVSGVSTTWETESVSNFSFEFSTQWPVIKKTMEALSDDLEAAIQSAPNKPASAEQNAAGQPATRLESK